MKMAHWGEFEVPEPQNEEVIHAEVVKYFIMKAMQQDSYKPPLPTPPQTQDDTAVDLNIPESYGLEMDDRVVHTMKLLQHSREMFQLIEAAKEQTELMADSQIHTFPPALEIPEFPIRENTYKVNLPLQYMDKEYSDFVLGKGQPLPEITTETAQQLLKKSVAAMLAHAGYDTTHESILDCLTDITEEYIKKMLKLLRIAVDEGANVQTTGFPDAIEKVFYEMNIGSVRTLHDYYQTRIIKYHHTILEECKALNAEYNNISIPVKSENLTMDTMSKIEEPDDVPEIHFPALGDGDGVDELQPSLEPGFQMLHSLEQEAHLQNLDSQEEEGVNISDSPSQDSTSMMTVDALQTHLMSKKRKRV